MINIKPILIAGILSLPGLASAESFPWLTFQLKDNSEISVASENLSMEYLSGNLVLTSAKVNNTIPVDNISSMSFTSVTAGVDTVDLELVASAKFFSLSGDFLGEYSFEEAKTILPSGVYVAKSKTKTVKVIF